MEITKEKFDSVVSKILSDFNDQMLNDTNGKGANFPALGIRNTAWGRIDTLLALDLINIKEWTALTCKVMDVYVFHINYVNPGPQYEEVTVFRKLTAADITFRRPA